MSENHGQYRVVIEGVEPQIDGGRFAVKRVVGEAVVVQADVFTDGHDKLSCRLLYRREQQDGWCDVPMKPLGNDRWSGEFRVSELGRYRYTIEGWIDRFRTWREDLLKRLEAEMDVTVDLLIGAGLVEEAAQRAGGEDGAELRRWARLIRDGSSLEARAETALDEDHAHLVLRHPDLSFATRFGKELTVTVDREKARFSAWYEMFPRSCAPEPGHHGTLRDCADWLPYISSMGFDVLYLPPVHPIGQQFRKGRNNVVSGGDEDVGSPWAIGSEEGGHKAIHPKLGTLEDFRYLVAKAAERGIEVALDIAFQCTPDHPYVREHPEWFRQRPDGTIQYAENPPKKYQDIYPINFETDNWAALWEELRSVMEFWVEEGVRIFRVDNPHTKSLYFWEWVIAQIQEEHPEVIFLAEAFTRPRVMYRLAKLGFSQSYTYFTWRNTKQELTDYFRELTTSDVKEYFRPNLWPNTPDILPEFLQVGGPPAFRIRFALAATLGASYGIYGPAFELCENAAIEPGSEEYLNSEKYELKHWDVDSPRSLKEFISRVNHIRSENPALQSDRGLRFHEIDNPLLICYSKTTEDLSNIILVIVNLDAFHAQSGWVDLDLHSLGLDPRQPFQAHDLVGGGRYLWEGSRNYVELSLDQPAYVFRVRRRVRTEKDFDYYL